MGGVWELDLDPPAKLVLLAMADHADHEGRNVRPSVDLVAWKTGYSPRQVQRIIRELERKHILIRTSAGSGGRGQSTHYRIDLEKGEKTPDFRGRDKLSGEQREAFLERLMTTTGTVCSLCGQVGNEKSAPDGGPWNVDRIVPARSGGRYEWGNVALACGACNKAKGAKMAPFIKGAIERVPSVKGAKMAPFHDAERVPSTTVKGAIHDTKGCHSYGTRTVREPSLEPSPPSPPPGRVYADMIGEERLRRGSAMLTQTNDALSYTWLCSVLGRAEETYGGMTGRQVRDGLQRGANEVVQVLGGDPGTIRAPKAWATKVLLASFEEARYGER